MTYIISVMNLSPSLTHISLVMSEMTYIISVINLSPSLRSISLVLISGADHLVWHISRYLGPNQNKVRSRLSLRGQGFSKWKWRIRIFSNIWSTRTECLPPTVVLKMVDKRIHSIKAPLRYRCGNLLALYLILSRVGHISSGGKDFFFFSRVWVKGNLSLSGKVLDRGHIFSGIHWLMGASFLSRHRPSGYDRSTMIGWQWLEWLTIGGPSGKDLQATVYQLTFWQWPTSWQWSAAIMAAMIDNEWWFSMNEYDPQQVHHM